MGNFMLRSSMKIVGTCFERNFTCYLKDSKTLYFDCRSQRISDESSGLIRNHLQISSTYSPILPYSTIFVTDSLTCSMVRPWADPILHVDNVSVNCDRHHGHLPLRCYFVVGVAVRLVFVIVNVIGVAVCDLSSSSSTSSGLLSATCLRHHQRHRGCCLRPDFVIVICQQPWCSVSSLLPLPLTVTISGGSAEVCHYIVSTDVWHWLLCVTTVTHPRQGSVPSSYYWFDQCSSAEWARAVELIGSCASPFNLDLVIFITTLLAQFVTYWFMVIWFVDWFFLYKFGMYVN